MKRVTHVEFYLFIKNYPNKLEADRVNFCEPATIQYNDFSGGEVWPKSVVASIYLYEGYPHVDRKAYAWKPNWYYIKEVERNPDITNGEWAT